MENIKDYTTLQLLDMYKKIIGKDIEEIIYYTFFRENVSNNTIKKTIDKNVKEENKESERDEMAYKLITLELYQNPEVNNHENTKLTLLLEIYRRCVSRMSSKEVNKLEDLILAKDSFFIYEDYHDSSNFDNLDKQNDDIIYKYEIVTRAKKEKSSSIHDKTSREVITKSIGEVVQIDDIPIILKDGYQKKTYEKIRYNILVKLLIENNLMTPREFNQNLAQDNFSKVLEVPEIKYAYEQLMRQFFIENLQFIDKTALLLNSAARIILGIRTAAGEKIEQVTPNYTSHDNLEKIMGSSIKFLEGINRELSKQEDGTKREYAIVTKDTHRPIIITNKKYIDDILSRCTKTTYLSEEEIQRMHEQIKDGILTDDFEKRKIANIGLEDLINTCKSYKSEQEYKDKERILKCGIEIAKYLKETNSITDKQLLDLYLNGELSFELISNIEMNEFNNDAYALKLKELYFTMTYFANTENEAEQFERLSKFCKLYKYLSKNEKVNMNEDQIIEELIDSYDIKYAPEILSDLYELDIITLEKGLEWVGADIFFEEYKKGRLKPQEVRAFYEEDKEHRLNQIIRIINKLADNGEKFMVIGSVFPEDTKEDRETRYYLFDECLKIEKGAENSKGNNARNSGNKKENDYYKHITDPFARISFIKALDKDYSFEMTADGHAIVKFPNFGKVIIEKMLDKNREPSYGAATYILDEEYYEYNKFRIKKDEKIVRQEIIKDIGSNQVTRIVHSVKSWGEDIKEYFLQTGKTDWSKDEIKVINEAIERVKASDPIAKQKKDEKQLAKMILNLIVTKNATLEQVKKIAEMYNVDLEKVMDSLEER